MLSPTSRMTGDARCADASMAAAKSAEHATMASVRTNIEWKRGVTAHCRAMGGRRQRALRRQGRMPATTDESDAQRLRSPAFHVHDRSVDKARAAEADERGRWLIRSFAPSGCPNW